MQVNNANVVKDELNKVGVVKSIQNDGEVWSVKFKNNPLEFDVRWDIVEGVNIKQIFTQSDVKPDDTIVVNLTFDL